MDLASHAVSIKPSEHQSWKREMPRVAVKGHIKERNATKRLTPGSINKVKRRAIWWPDDPSDVARACTACAP